MQRKWQSMKYGCDKCNKVFNRLLLANPTRRDSTRLDPSNGPSLSLTPKPGNPGSQSFQASKLRSCVSKVRICGAWGMVYRGVATIVNSVGGHYSRTMLNKFKCLFCKYVNGITDGKERGCTEQQKHQRREAGVRGGVVGSIPWVNPCIPYATCSSFYFAKS